MAHYRYEIHDEAEDRRGHGRLSHFQHLQPEHGREAIGLKPLMLLCNVILRVLNGETEISAIGPVASMAAVESKDLPEGTGKIREMLRQAVDVA